VFVSARTHENTNLMFQHSGLAKLKLGDEVVVSSIYHCLTYFQCNPPSTACSMGQCEQCGNSDKLKQILTDLFHENRIDEVSFSQWMSSARSELETNIKASISAFVKEFLISTKKYQKHNFLAKVQGSHYKELKANLFQGQVLITLDFSENYTNLRQVSTQFNNFNRF